MKRSIALLILILTFIITGVSSECKMIKVYLGKYYVSTYHASDNTPAGTHNTSSGKRAIEGYTVAVDHRNPIVPMHSTVFIQGFGKLKVMDYGGFGHYNGGLRQFDVFMPEGQGGLFYRKCWYYRHETKKEKEKRLRKKREKRQDQFFTLAGGKNRIGTVIADPEYIKKGSTVLIGMNFYEVIGTQKGLGNTLKIGGLSSERAGVKLSEVVENARG